MKRFHLISLSVYVIFIIYGFRIGNILKQDETAAITRYPQPSVLTSVPTLKNGQHNLLIITTDDLDQPLSKLVSIWLVTYFTDKPSVSFLPIYPNLSAGNEIADEQLTNSFEVIPYDGQYLLSEAFLEILAQHNFWWSGYMIVDQYAISWLPDLSNKIDAGDPTPYDQNDSIQMGTGENLEFNYLHDMKMIQEICHQIALQGTNFNWQVFRKLIPQHISSDLDVDFLINEWNLSLQANETPLCRFPLELGVH